MGQAETRHIRYVPGASGGATGAEGTVHIDYLVTGKGALLAMAAGYMVASGSFVLYDYVQESIERRRRADGEKRGHKGVEEVQEMMLNAGVFGFAGGFALCGAYLFAPAFIRRWWAGHRYVPPLQH